METELIVLIALLQISIPGADDLKQLRELDEEDFKQLCATISMASKPFHMIRFRKALRKYPPNTHTRSLGTVTVNNIESRQEISQLPSASIFPLTSAQPLHGLPRQPIRFAVSQPLTVPIFPTVAHNRSPTVHVASVNVVTPQASYIHPIQHPPALLQLQSPIATSPRQPPMSNKNGATSQKEAPEKLKKLFLPPYLKPGSDCRSFDDLIDDLTPVQKELGPCPFSPNVWDPKRAELIRKYSTIYGQNVNKRKHGALTSHEENVNEAANQLCLRDPTLLVRREELLVLARRAVKEGGYVFIHGHSRTKDGENSLLQKRPRSSSDYFDDDVSQPLAKRSIQTPKLRERRLERITELDLLITENKAEQSVKLATLEKAQQTDDFSAAYHIQFEMESLGNTLHQLQKEYSALKKKQRRSERYFESKHREKDVPEGRGQSQSRSSDDEDDNGLDCNEDNTTINPDRSPGVITSPIPLTLAMKDSTLQQQQPSRSRSSVSDDGTPHANRIISCSSPLELAHDSMASAGHSTPLVTTTTGRGHSLTDSTIGGHCRTNPPEPSVASSSVRITTASPVIASSSSSTEVALEFERRHVPIYPTRHLQHVTAQVLRNRSRESNHLRGQRYTAESRTTNEMTRLLSDFNQ